MIDFENVQHLHFIGIGGISMSGLAEVLLGRGLQISGSDMQTSEMTARLEKLGAQIFIGQSAENITAHAKPDAVIYTAAIHPDNPEFMAAQELGIPCISRAELLGQMMSYYKETIAVAGTHGKTTTTGMIAQMLLEAQKDPTVSIGGMLASIGGNIRVGKSEFFLTEACEYTNSYHTLHPKYALILNVDADHLDFFGDLDGVEASFRTFAEGLADGGTLFIARDGAAYERITKNLPAEVISIALAGDADVTASDIHFDARGCASFTALEKGAPLGTFQLQVPGEHNVLNALFVIALGRQLMIPVETIAAGLTAYGGTGRRFEYKGTMNGVAVVDDYAHHPTEIRATLTAAKRLEHRELWVAFQPHTYTRTTALLTEFRDALSLADHVVLAEIYAAREVNESGISSKDLADAIASSGVDACFFPTFSEICDYLRTNCMDGDLLITMGAGNITDLGPMLLSDEAF